GFLFRLEVIDTGPGMEQGQLDRLFGAFDQLEPSTVRTHGGTGLGLHISRELARMMGGDLTADSAPGRGALFRLVTPMEFARPVDQTSRPVQAPEPEPALGLRVL